MFGGAPPPPGGPPLRRAGGFAVGGLLVEDAYVTVPLDHGAPRAPGAPTIDVFVRVCASRARADDAATPYLLYLQGGPGFEAPRPLDGGSGWLKAAAAQFHVVLMDQRGTGRSAPVTAANLAGGRHGGAEGQAAHLRHFRADSIVADAEAVRAALVPPGGPAGGRWTLLGQSFGGFCVFSYLSFAPAGVAEALVTGGAPPLAAAPPGCAADAVYAALFRRVLRQNDKFYERFPAAAERAARVVRHLAAQPGGAVTTPAGNRLAPRGLQALGLSCLGFALGFERLHFMLEGAFDGDRLAFKFLKECDAAVSFDANPLYALLHEPCYCNGGGAAPAWAAARALEGDPELAAAFDAAAAAAAGRRVNFFGEAVFPWTFDDVAALRPLRGAAEAVAAAADWPPLYDAAALAANEVPLAAAVYWEDMFVDAGLSAASLAGVGGPVRVHVTNEWLHDGIRENGAALFERLLGMARGHVLLR